MTGFRVLSPAQRIFKDARKAVTAKAFAPDVRDFLKKSLTSAIKLTPVRDISLIRRNQRKQYKHRINYIPSFHTLENPSLIVKDDGSEWLFTNGKWYRPDIWNIPDEAWDHYTTLLHERDRRMQTALPTFIEQRTQARFLFQKTWWEIGQSAGINIACGSGVRASITRRRKPPLNPPKGYAQTRGGKDAYSIVVRNPFLDQTSPGGHTPLSTEKYKPFSGQEIIEKAMAMHRPEFERKVAERHTKTILRIIRLLLR